MRQSSIIYIVLFMLSFNISHDSFISIIEKGHDNKNLHYICDIEDREDCLEFNNIHSLLHFIAIIDTDKNSLAEQNSQENNTLILVQYTPPPQKTSIKPPII